MDGPEDPVLAVDSYRTCMSREAGVPTVALPFSLVQ